jgi:hypothetical protein
LLVLASIPLVLFSLLYSSLHDLLIVLSFVRDSCADIPLGIYPDDLASTTTGMCTGQSSIERSDHFPSIWNEDFARIWSAVDGADADSDIEMLCKNEAGQSLIAQNGTLEIPSAIRTEKILMS